MPDKIPNPRGAFGFFRAQVSNVSRLSPTFLRVTFTGQALRHFGNPQRTLDQRIKLVFPGPDGLRIYARAPPSPTGNPYLTASAATCARTPSATCWCIQMAQQN